MAKQTAKLNYLKIAPRKVRLVAHSIKGLPVQEAEAQLLMKPQRSAPALLKLLRSAVANAKSRDIKTDNLYISEIRVDQGPMMKRWLPRAMGRATPLQKKMSHITLVLDEAKKATPPRFNIIVPKKSTTDKTKADKKKQIKEKKIAPKKLAATDEAGTVEKPNKEGVFKRFFRRKSI